MHRRYRPSRFASPPHEMTSRHVPFSDEVYNERVKELRSLVNEIDSHFTHPFNIPWRTNEKGQMEFARPMAQWAWKTMIIVEGSCSTQADYIYLKELLGSLLEAIKKGENVFTLGTEEEPPRLLPKYNNLAGWLKQDREDLLANRPTKEYQNPDAPRPSVSRRWLPEITDRMQKLYRLRLENDSPRV
ncbi:hypothetical protein JCM5350_006518 [Sporobolomyces pararoseus]